jgi:hypothetical protein
MNKQHFFEPSDRYKFDFNLCSRQKGYAQVDTEQDAHYYGTWANPAKLMVVSYVEGDVYINTADNQDEFITELRNIKAWNENNGWKFKGIDCLCDDNIKQSFVDMGLADLLY